MNRGKPLARGTKPIRKVSDKKAKTKTAAGRAYMGEVVELDCCTCGRVGCSEAHHCRSGGMARDDFKTIPLCYDCHRGVNGYHLAKRAWEAANGPDHGFIAQTQMAILGEEL